METAQFKFRVVLLHDRLDRRRQQIRVQRPSLQHNILHHYI